MNKLSKILFYLAVLSIPFYVLRFKIIIPTTITEVLIYLAFVAAVLSSRAKRSVVEGSLDHTREASSDNSGLRPRSFVALRMTDRGLKLFLASIIFVFIALLAALHDPSRAAALGIWKAYFFDGIILLFTYYLLSDENKVRNTTNYLLKGGLLLSLVTLIIFLLGTKNSDGRLLDLAGLNPNYLGMYLVPIFLLNVSKIFEKGQKLIKRNLEIISAIVIVTAIFLTGSRGAYLATFIALVGFLISKTKYFKPIFVGLIVATLIAGGILFRPEPNDLGRTGSSSNIRYLIWTTSFEIVQKNPILGVGLNNYQPYFKELTNDRVNYPEFISPLALTAHDIYLHLLVIGGPLLLLAFLFLIYQSKFWRFENIYSFALFSILIYGLVDTPFFRNDLALAFWLILVLICSSSFISRSKRNI